MRETAARERRLLFLAAVAAGEDDAPAAETAEATWQKTASGGLSWSSPTTTWDVSDLGPKSWWRAQYYYRARWYAPGISSFLERDPLGPIDSFNLYQLAGYSSVNYVDPSGLAGYFFDGTWNNEASETNVSVLYQLYRDQRGGESFYTEGVGTGGFIDRNWSGLTGYGTRSRVRRAHRRLQLNFEAGDTTIDVFGFSRGAAAAREFAWRVHTHGVNLRDGTIVRPQIRFLGLFDTVYSMDWPVWPSASSDLGYNNGIAFNVQNVRHAIALDERRAGFGLTSICPSGGCRDRTRIEEPFPGSHSDIGGGYSQNRGPANVVLLWMWTEARNLEVPLRDIPERYQVIAGENLMYHDSRTDDSPETGDPEAVSLGELRERNEGTGRGVYRPAY